MNIKNAKQLPELWKSCKNSTINIAESSLFSFSSHTWFQSFGIMPSFDERIFDALEATQALTSALWKRSLQQDQMAAHSSQYWNHHWQ